MGAAEIISLDEVRARKQWESLRQQLHARFDQWLDRLEEQWPEAEPTLTAVTETVWDLRQALTGSLAETIVAHTHQDEYTRQQSHCPQCNLLLTARASVPRTVETMVGPVQLERPYFYCRSCHRGVYPLDEVLGLTAGRIQLDVQQVAAKLVTEVPYDEAHALFRDLTGLGLGSERMHTLTNHVAEGLTVLDVAPSRDEIERRITEVAAGRWRRPVVVLGIDGAYVPTRPESARAPQKGQRRTRAKRAQWRGQWRDAKGLRLYLLDGDRIVHLLSWHQVQTEAQLGEALTQVKKAGVIPEDRVRLCVVADGAEWIWKHVKALFPHACQVLDYYHCAQYIHNIAKAQYGTSLQGLEWAEATMTRLYLGKVSAVLGGLRRMQPMSDEAAQAITNGWAYLDEHRGRTHYRQLRRGGYPLGSGGIEASNKFICHVRLKRSGAWWYEANSNKMLALRCAKYNGTLAQVFMRYQQRLRETSE
jgi:hypothetical protein